MLKISILFSCFLVAVLSKRLQYEAIELLKMYKKALQNVASYEHEIDKEGIDNEKLQRLMAAELKEHELTHLYINLNSLQHSLKELQIFNTSVSYYNRFFDRFKFNSDLDLPLYLSLQYNHFRCDKKHCVQRRSAQQPISLQQLDDVYSKLKGISRLLKLETLKTIEDIDDNILFYDKKRSRNFTDLDDSSDVVIGDVWEEDAEDVNLEDEEEDGKEDESLGDGEYGFSNVVENDFFHNKIVKGNTLDGSGVGKISSNPEGEDDKSAGGKASLKSFANASNKYKTTIESNVGRISKMAEKIKNEKIEYALQKVKERNMKRQNILENLEKKRLELNESINKLKRELKTFGLHKVSSNESEHRISKRESPNGSRSELPVERDLRRLSTAILESLKRSLKVNKLKIMNKKKDMNGVEGEVSGVNGVDDGESVVDEGVSGVDEVDEGVSWVDWIYGVNGRKRVDVVNAIKVGDGVNGIKVGDGKNERKVVDGVNVIKVGDGVNGNKVGDGVEGVGEEYHKLFSRLEVDVKVLDEMVLLMSEWYNRKAVQGSELYMELVKLAQASVG